MVEEYIIEGRGAHWEVQVDITHMIVWLTAMQVVLAITSGAMNERFGMKAPAPGSLAEKAMLKKVELNVKSFSVLLSHVAGFSAINAWGSVQQHYFAGSPSKAALVLPLSLV